MLNNAQFDMNIKLTVAISVYNVPDYIEQTLDCVLSQTFSEFEIICIDDASSDDTWNILYRYSQMDQRIRLIRQASNKGLSVSRNIAIAEAKGEYILMLDGDDLFASDMLEKAYQKAKETNADMTLWDYVVFVNADTISEKKSVPSVLSKLNLADKISLLRQPAFMWTKLFRTQWLRDMEISFTSGLTKQDIPVFWKVVTNTDKIAVVPERLSYYRIQPNQTSSRKDKSVYALAYVMDITKQQLLEDGLYEKYRNEFLRSRLSLLQGMYDHINDELKPSALTLITDRLGDDELSYIMDSNNQLSSRVRNFYRMLRGESLATLKYTTFNIIRGIYRKLR